MQWVNCKDRVELDKYGNSVKRYIKYKLKGELEEIMDVAQVGKRGKSGNFYIVFESFGGWNDNTIMEHDEFEYCLWLDETEESKAISSKNDWQSIEERFTREYHGRVLKNNPMLCWEIVQWFKENVKCIGK